MQKITHLIALIVGVTLGYLLAERSLQAENPIVTQHEESRDTMIYRDLPPVEVRHITKQETSVSANYKDTTLSHSPIMEYYFRDTLDSRWSAVITGRDVELSKLWIANKTIRSREFYTPKWQISTVAIASPDAMWAGVEVSRSIRRNATISLAAGYDPIRGKTHTQAKIAWVLWRE